jgi:effector-binding domain-containing protein
MSRARFYQLQKEGIFPRALYDPRTNRPFFDTLLQDICHEVRETGIGFNGQYILFYSRRKNNSDKPKRKKSNSQYAELIETLKQMGLQVTNDQIEQAVQELYPQGLDKEDMGIVVRELFRFLKGKM